MGRVSEVRLTDGIFRDSQDLGKRFLMSLDVDKLLAPVAHSTGASGDISNYYGGWEAYTYRSYSGNGISGHSLGHYLSAASAMYAATGDMAVKERLDYAVCKLSGYQQTDGTGYIGGVEKDKLVSSLRQGIVEANGFELNGYWVPWYSFHKIYQGLIDAFTLAGNEQALTVVRGFADWAIDVTGNLTDEKFDRMLESEYGGMNEVFAELYNITGEGKYLDMALKFSQSSILEPLSCGIDELEGKHANTQIPKIIGAAAIYEINKDRTDYRDAAMFFYDTVVNHRSYVIGGNSNREHFGSISEEALGPQTLETCNTYNMLKLTEHLYSWTRSASYMDYYERALFNHILASQDNKSGEKTYFMATTPGHFKVYSDALNGNSFWCCTGSGMENPARYTRNIYYKDGGGFYINQFISSTVTWKEKGLKISQTTNYPYEDTSVIKIECGNAYAELNIRIPEWTNNASVSVNGDTVTVSDTGYYKLEREWSEGDTVTVKLPMELRVYTARDDNHKAAFMYGPVVLAGRLGTETFPKSDNVDNHTSLDNFTPVKVPDIIVNSREPDTFITPDDISKLQFEMTSLNGAVITLIPYADLHHERYSLYWRLYSSDESKESGEHAERLGEITSDTVYTGEQQPEIDHNMEESNSSSGYDESVSKSYRKADSPNAYFSYELKTEAGGSNYAAVIYDGEVDVFADGILLGKISESGAYSFYRLPGCGRETIRITFRSQASGRVFEVRTTNGTI